MGALSMMTNSGNHSPQGEPLHVYDRPNWYSPSAFFGVTTVSICAKFRRIRNQLQERTR